MDTGNALRCYVDGQWVAPHSPLRLEVVDPARGAVIARAAMGDATDVERAVNAARRAFDGFAAWPAAHRAALLRRVIACYAERAAELAELVSAQLGCPMTLAREAQVPAGLDQLQGALDALEHFEFESRHGDTLILHEPVGVCALITPWNWPLNQIAAKVGPALAAGATMVLKPSELTPLDAVVFTEILDAAGVPPGVFNLVNGTGGEAGAALAAHPDVDMVSFTGSTRAGADVARCAAGTVKRVCQELGGKSAHVLLDDADVPAVVSATVRAVAENSGQSCDATTRIVLPADRLAEAEIAARSAAESLVVGDPRDAGTDLGPVVSRRQFERVQALIEQALTDGARLVAGGPGRPAGLAAELMSGWYVRPTVLADVTSDMAIAQEEVFGPVVVLLGAADDDDAVRIANDSRYGLSGRVTSADPARAAAIARRLRTGMVYVNDAGEDVSAPFGGYKQSGNGRESGRYGLLEYLETKAMIGVAGR